MPQLVPFYFVNEVVFAFVIITVFIYVLSKYTLPSIVNLYIARAYISNLFKSK